MGLYSKNTGDFYLQRDRIRALTKQNPSQYIYHIGQKYATVFFSGPLQLDTFPKAGTIKEYLKTAQTIRIRQTSRRVKHWKGDL
jgi:hypothetical protein